MCCFHSGWWNLISVQAWKIFEKWCLNQMCIVGSCQAQTSIFKPYFLLQHTQSSTANPSALNQAETCTGRRAHRTDVENLWIRAAFLRSVLRVHPLHTWTEPLGTCYSGTGVLGVKIGAKMMTAWWEWAEKHRTHAQNNTLTHTHTSPTL